ncbi:hypothetical protein PR202_ga14999 [Eleusine coracana subsp. coracana]|uniref:Uncharacterized protein n=1 Tax=Eleusine coracana subsp. coracana TaxID=191504 RepID=A0AAV5CIM0_ELECO|nr:hypothetical protein PR202_ga14999 [Eleusine coracana subsp. coracana]
MPPRRRPLPPPPAAEPSLASELHVDPVEEPDPDTATPTIQPRPGIVTNLPPGPRAVYLAIFAAGSNGVMMPELCRETGMVSSTARRHVNVLKKAQLVKEICDARKPLQEDPGGLRLRARLRDRRRGVVPRRPP